MPLRPIPDEHRPAWHGAVEHVPQFTGMGSDQCLDPIPADPVAGPVNALGPSIEERIAYGAFFDRHLSWDEKLAAMDTRTRRKFEDWRGADKNPAGETRKKGKKKQE